MKTTSFPDNPAEIAEDLPEVIGNHTGYPHDNAANWEHDDTGSANNYSGCEDMMFSAEAEHEDWQAGYDYD